ncbi:unnamed protein product, partial [Amoebophrya sp. A120]|eukprot:GSA120T00025914001.1
MAGTWSHMMAGRKPAAANCLPTRSAWGRPREVARGPPARGRAAGRINLSRRTRLPGAFFYVCPGARVMGWEGGRRSTPGAWRAGSCSLAGAYCLIVFVPRGSLFWRCSRAQPQFPRKEKCLAALGRFPVRLSNHRAWAMRCRPLAWRCLR